MIPRVGYLGPEGTFSEEALLSSAAPESVQPVPHATIYDTVMALRAGDLEWAVVPIENSLDGSISVTLDLLADEAGDVEIVGETLLTVSHSLIAARALELQRDRHGPHPPAGSGAVRAVPARRARPRAGASRQLDRRGRAGGGRGCPARARGAGHAARGRDLRRNGPARGRAGPRRQRDALRVAGSTGARERLRRRRCAEPTTVAVTAAAATRRWKTSLVFWGAGADSPGWLVRCLDEFARREINLTKIESRPRRERLGHYMFFVDLEGGAEAERSVERRCRRRARDVRGGARARVLPCAASA